MLPLGPRLVGLVLGLLVFALPAVANAFTYESIISAGCHERLASRALREVRRDLPARAPTIEPSRNDRALIQDLPFEREVDMHDLSGAAIAIGVRDNDLKGRGPAELDQLGAIHGDPKLQKEHCLRTPEQDGPDGSRLAVDDCRAFIRERVAAALAGLDGSGIPDPNKLTRLEVTLIIRGHVRASLPLFWIEIGRALHTLQDSFTHTFRTPDRRTIRTVLNYAEDVEGTRDEPRDGPAHRGELDECDSLDTLRAQNFEAAAQASRELLRAALDPAAADDAARLAAVDVVLANWLSYEPGCSADNGWCDAPERAYQVSAGCGIARTEHPSHFGLVLVGLLGVMTAFRRRASIAAAVGTLFSSASTAAAQTAPTAPQEGPEVFPDPAPPKTPTPTERVSEQREQEHRSRFGIHGAISGGFSNESFNGQLGGRLRLSRRWTVGLDAELNGWFGFNGGNYRLGAFNGYGTVIFRTPLRYAEFNLRTTANLGVSTLLVDLYGAPRGSTGIFVGLTPLGLEWKVASSVFVVIDALGVAIPVPQLDGAPFAYPQYRTSLGVEISL